MSERRKIISESAIAAGEAVKKAIPSEGVIIKEGRGIASEAGAMITGLDGRDITFMSPDVVIGNETLVTQFLGEIQ